MKKILLFSSVILFLIYFYTNYINNNSEITNRHFTKKVEIKTNKKLVKTNNTKVITSNLTDESIKFNKMINEDLNRNNFNSKYHEIDRLYDKERIDSIDIENEIKTYIGNIEKYQLQIDALSRKCVKLNDRINYQSETLNSNLKLEIGFYNQHYFDQGLFNSGFCSKPDMQKNLFWEFVKIARSGNKLAQLLLFDKVFDAVSNGKNNILSVRKKPLEYKNIRDEAINYLKILSHNGIYKASIKLSQIFSDNNWSIVQNNPVLAYYYSFLAEKQYGFVEGSFENNLDTIYLKLTTKQKELVDRMISKL